MYYAIHTYMRICVYRSIVFGRLLFAILCTQTLRSFNGVLYNDLYNDFQFSSFAILKTLSRSNKEDRNSRRWKRKKLTQTRFRLCLLSKIAICILQHNWNLLGERIHKPLPLTFAVQCAFSISLDFYLL